MIQLSINAMKPLAYHLDLGAKLAPLRRRGVLIVGSGNIVHNLRRVDASRPTGALDWAQRFNDATRDRLIDAPADAASLADHPDYERAVPTADHFIPALYLAGLAAAEKSAPNVLIDGYAYGSLSMTAYGLNGHCPTSPTTGSGAAAFPDVPADESNI